MNNIYGDRNRTAASASLGNQTQNENFPLFKFTPLYFIQLTVP